MYVIVFSNDKDITKLRKFEVHGTFIDKHSAALFLRESDYMSHVGDVYWVGTEKHCFSIARICKVTSP